MIYKKKIKHRKHTSRSNIKNIKSKKISIHKEKVISRRHTVIKHFILFNKRNIFIFLWAFIALLSVIIVICAAIAIPLKLSKSHHYHSYNCDVHQLSKNKQNPTVNVDPLFKFYHDDKQNDTSLCDNDVTTGWLNTDSRMIVGTDKGISETINPIPVNSDPKNLTNEYFTNYGTGHGNMPFDWVNCHLIINGFLLVGTRDTAQAGDPGDGGVWWIKYTDIISGSWDFQDFANKPDWLRRSQVLSIKYYKGGIYFSTSSGISAFSMPDSTSLTNVNFYSIDVSKQHPFYLSPSDLVIEINNDGELFVGCDGISGDPSEPAHSQVVFGASIKPLTGNPKKDFVHNNILFNKYNADPNFAKTGEIPVNSYKDASISGFFIYSNFLYILNSEVGISVCNLKKHEANHDYSNMKFFSYLPEVSTPNLASDTYQNSAFSAYYNKKLNKIIIGSSHGVIYTFAPFADDTNFYFKNDFFSKYNLMSKTDDLTLHAINCACWNENFIFIGIFNYGLILYKVDTFI